VTLVEAVTSVALAALAVGGPVSTWVTHRGNRRKAAQLREVIHEVKPNSGGSMRDAVDRIEQAVSALGERVGELEVTAQRRRFGRRKRSCTHG